MNIEDYPQLHTGMVALAPGPPLTGYLYVPVEPGGLVPAVTPPPTTVEGYPVMTTQGVGIANDGGIWQLQPTRPGGITEVIPSLLPPSLVTPPLLNYVTGGGGAGNVGSIYQGGTGTWTPSAPTPVYTRQWIRNGSPIAGSTGATYTIATADIGTIINCLVTATNPAGSSSPHPASNPVGPIPDPGLEDEARLDDNGAAQSHHVVAHGGGQVHHPKAKAKPKKKR